ncbi:MAG: DNA cytosine methyltransferase [Negativicutes bacterium]
MSKREINYIDLFAGTGGLSEGFTVNEYNPVAHVEMNRDACSSLRTRACYHYLKKKETLVPYYDYLKGNINREELYALVPETVLDAVIHQAMSDENMPSVFNRIDKLMKANGIKHIDLIVGGPPCQAYSLAGRSRVGEAIANDPRNYLYKIYCKVLCKYQPEMFVFENVPGLLTASKGKYFENMQEEFDQAGYEIHYNILNAADFGVLQNRRRVILIGWKKGSAHTYPTLQKRQHSYQLQDIFADLPPLQPGEESGEYASLDYCRYLKETGIRKSSDVLTWHVARTNIDRDREIYREVIKMWNDKHRRLKYTELPDKLCTHKNRTAFLDRFKVVTSDLTACHTVVAHISKDGHYFIHPDIKQARSISVREAARIQSFPDDFFFEESRTAAFTQIGNAVPPLMASGIAKAMKENFR